MSNVKIYNASAFVIVIAHSRPIANQTMVFHNMYVRHAPETLFVSFLE